MSQMNRKSSNLLLWGSTFIVQYVIGETNCICFAGCPLQAFLELNSEECAQTMVSYYSSVTPVIRNHPIYMQYSTHKELKTDNSPNQVVRGSHLSQVLLHQCLDLFLKCVFPLACSGSSTGSQCPAWRWNGKHAHFCRCK